MSNYMWLKLSSCLWLLLHMCPQTVPLTAPRSTDRTQERQLSKDSSTGVGLHPTGLQALRLPSCKTEERAQRQWQRHQYFNGWGSLHVWSKKGPGETPHWGQQIAVGHGRSLHYQGKREVTNYRRNWCQAGSSVTRETSRGAHPSLTLWRRGVRHSNLKIRTVASWGLGKVPGSMTKKECLSGELGIGEAGTGRAGDMQRPRDQLS